MRTAAVTWIAVSLSVGPLWSTPAMAQDKAACLDAAAKAQKLRSAHLHVEARDQLRICSAATCPTAIQQDCSGWLIDVENGMPTVVVTAKDRAGADLFDVKVTVDGKPLASKLDGRAEPMDPGPHAFHFDGADGSTLDRQVMVREGEKNQEIAVVLGPTPPTPAAPPPTAPAPDAGATQDTGGSVLPWKTIGWIAGGVGIVGLGVGATFGVIALHDKGTAGCNADEVCKTGTTSAIKTSSLVSDIGWIAGGVLLASGAALVLWAPSGQERAPTAIRVAPSLVAGGAGAMVGGAW